MEPLSLFELNNIVRETIEYTLDQSYWVTAELSEVRLSAKGHCFLELVEKHPNGSTPIAKAKAVIMSYVYPMIKMSFEEATNQSLCTGLKVQLKVDISFSEVYGYSLIVKDIDPTYTLGSLAQLRKEILDKLTQDGIIDMNKMLTLPRPLQRIAVISSATAAGYGDFCNQLDTNSLGVRFTHKLFQAAMQGADTAFSIIHALDQIAYEADMWDAVVIIRGGGAVSDLAGFEDYDLAACCAQFPLPVITGIGHERDTTVLDFVANTHLKTPTAVAAFLLDQMAMEIQWLKDTEKAIYFGIQQQTQETRTKLNNLINTINNKARLICHDKENKLSVTYERLCQKLAAIVRQQQLMLPQDERIIQLARRTIANHQQRLQTTQRALEFYDPMKILNLGYSLTRVNGHVVKSIDDIAVGDTLHTTLAKGEIYSTVNNKQNNPTK